MDKKLNLKIINRKYKLPTARKGLAVLKRLIIIKDDYSLSELLRNHREKGVRYFFELEYRDDIDDLLDYYSLLEVGIIAGYFPKKLTKSIVKEIKQILDNRIVKAYYKEFYPLYLPQLLLQNINKESSTEIGTETKSQYYYESFLIINGSIKFDQDVELFLWFLDGGMASNYSILDFWEILEDASRINYKLHTRASHPLNHAFWGFIKYLQFLHEYTDLLKKIDSERLLQSAFWHYQSYWLNNENRLKDIVEKGIGNIKKAINSISTINTLENTSSYISNDEEYADWRNNLESLNDIENDIKYLYSPSIKLPVIEELKINVD